MTPSTAFPCDAGPPRELQLQVAPVTTEGTADALCGVQCCQEYMVLHVLGLTNAFLSHNVTELQ